MPCNTCHGPGSNGVGGVFPALAGQYAPYLIKQLQDFRQGVRGNDPQQLMSTVALRMTDAEIAAVAAYLESVSPTSTQGVNP